MNYLKNFLFILFILFALSKPVFAELPVYLDFKFILNNSTAGKKAQDSLKKKLDSGIKSLNSKEKSIQEDERKIIQQKKVNELRKKVSSLQKERNKLLESVAKDRIKAKNELLKNLNPIIEAYMQEKKIRLVIDKKNIILADEKLDITKEIIKILNNKLQSIKLN